MVNRTQRKLKIDVLVNWKNIADVTFVWPGNISYWLWGHPVHKGILYGSYCQLPVGICKSAVTDLRDKYIPNCGLNHLPLLMLPLSLREI